MTLLEALTDDIRNWLAHFDGLLSNERDLQVKLAMWLERSEYHYDNIHTEYRVPLEELIRRGMAQGDNFPWSNQISIDLVVEKDGHFVAIELKYATSSVVDELTIFDECLMDENSRILKDQAAYNITMYHYWKDVRRIEVFTKAFKKVDGGIALMVSNSRALWTEPREGANCLNFSMHEGNTLGHGLLAWKNTISETVHKTIPDFRMDASYVCHWHETAMPFQTKGGEKFRYMFSVIKKQQS